MRTLSKVSLMLALIAVPVIALAHPGGPGPGRPMMEKFDKNGDGTLDATERAAMIADRRARNLAEFDTNKDGVLDATERAAMQARRAAMRAERVDREFARLDTNKDGSISKAEFAAGMKGPGMKGRGDWHGRGRGRGFGAHDGGAAPGAGPDDTE